MQRMVMIIGAGIFQIPLIKEAKRQGLTVLAVDMNPSAPGFRYADIGEYISTKDIARCIACAQHYARTYDLRGVVTAGTDVSYTVASVADALSLPGIKPQVALNATDKYRMRSCMASCGIPTPRFTQTTSLQGALEAAARIGYPLVIKPVDNMGARGVRRVDTPEELVAQFPKSLSFSGHVAEAAVIIEEYMEGPEISMDTLVYDGIIHLLTVADRHISAPPYFIEYGHSVPSLLPPATIADAFDMMKRAIGAVGIDCGAAKADIKITPEGPRIGEITARLSGGFHSQYTDPLATGMNTTKAALDIAIGNALVLRDITPAWHRTAIERALFPEPGRVTSISGVADAQCMDGICDIFINVAPGDIIEPLTSNIGKAGHIIAFGIARADAEAAYERAHRAITIETEPICASVV